MLGLKIQRGEDDDTRLFGGDLTLARRMARKGKKKMKFDEQDRVRDHAL